MRAALLTLELVACRSTGGPYDPAEGAARNTIRAQELNARAADLVGSTNTAFSNGGIFSPQRRRLSFAELSHFGKPAFQIGHVQGGRAGR